MATYALLSDNSVVTITDEIQWDSGRVFFILFDEEQTDADGDPDASVDATCYETGTNLP